MKYNKEYLDEIKSQKEVKLGIELLYSGGIGCGFFLIGISALIVSINYCFN